jgi:hypothetical protein
MPRHAAAAAADIFADIDAAAPPIRRLAADEASRNDSCHFFFATPLDD